MLSIINTWKCNFKCGHCLFSCSPKRTGFLNRYDLIDYCAMMGRYDDLDYVNLCGGEAFLHPDLIWQVDYLIGAGCNVRIPTNGVLLYKKAGEEFLEHFYGQERITLMISNDPYHAEFWPRWFSVDKAERMVSSYDISIEKDRRNYNNYYCHMGRAKKHGLGDPDDTKGRTCIDRDSYQTYHRFEPTLLPDGKIASCCSARLIVGDAQSDYNTMQERFKQYMKDNSEHSVRCSTCPRSIIDYKLKHKRERKKKRETCSTES